jgi:LssY C-terminus
VRVRAFSRVVMFFTFTVAIALGQNSGATPTTQSSGTSTAAAPSTSAAPIPQDYSLSVSSVQAWTDTGIELHSGDVAQISTGAKSASTGFDQGGRNLHAVPAGASCDPQGAANSSAAGSSLPLATALPGALIGKVAGGAAFLVGVNKEVKADQQGHLFLGPNISGDPECKGTYAVKVHLVSSSGSPESLATKQTTEKASDMKSKLSAAAQVWMAGQFGAGANNPTSGGSSALPGNAAETGAGANAAAVTTSLKPIKISSEALDPKLAKEINGLPRRVNDEFKNPGDMVNFVIVGSEKDVQSALESANWFVADRNNAEAVAKAVLMTYQKKDYLQMPMSLLYLFDRVQDFGYEQAEPYSVVASRHHFRIWKAPFEYNDKQVWVGAGTHDIGFEKDQRNGKVTHKIDPAVDGERDNIAASLEKSGKVKTIAYYTPPNPVQDARNATGGGYHSDGRIVVITLQ